MKKIIILLTIVASLVACQEEKPELKKIEPTSQTMQQTEEAEQLHTPIEPVLSNPNFAEYKNAGDVVDKLKKVGLPITGIVVYTEENDPNEQMGRPKSYIAKANFDDSRIKIAKTEFGTIELFTNAEDLDRRYKHVENVTDSMPTLVQYMYVHKNILLRVHKKLTPKQASEYEQALKTL